MGKKNYTQEFKEEAVDLANRKGAAAAAEQLGINPGNIHRWKSEFKNPIPQEDIDLEKENKRLRKEIEYLRKINEVLKKSTAIFSQDHHPYSRP
jgi:transposase